MKRIDLRAWKLWRIDAAGAAACLVFTLLVYFAGIRPVLGKRAHAADNRVRLNAQRRKCSELASVVVALRRQLAATQKALASSTIRLQPPSRVNQRIAGIADLAAKSGLKIDATHLGPSSSTPRYTAVPITLAGTGTYRTCITFLRRLNQAFPDTCVTMSDLSANPADPTGEAAFRFQLLWYAAPAGGSAKE